MDLQDIMPIIIQIVLIPVLTALTGVAVKWINCKANEIKLKTDNVYLKQCIDILNDSITTAVIAFNQTYVEELKAADSFDKEQQKEVFVKVYNTVINSLTEEAKVCLESNIGSLEEYISNKIEETVVSVKEAE